ncbi:MAG: dihydroorotate dehydrogenase [Candidatus Marinimicrobia bacterium CG1_02_48_14]|nr:MAG: dihydroorotate dehydrogenase [Candidatus Marinimicrobia bacterium CG1_02_48_14]
MRLKTTYMGLELKNPLVPSASPMSREVDTVKKLEDAGAPAIIMYSLFEEQIHHEANELDHFLSHGTDSFAEALSYFPEPEDFSRGPDEYLEHLQKLKSAVDIPVIASLNGISIGGWIDYAHKMETAGADGLELNVYYLPTDLKRTSESVENLYVEILKAVKGKVHIPVSMKLSPYFSSLPAFAKRLVDNGVDALALFNRFYQPDIDLENLEIEPSVILSSSDELRLPLRWIAVLSASLHVNLGATTGVHTAEDAIKLLMVGADATMMCSALLKNGPGHITQMLNDMIAWLDEHEYESVEQLKGSMNYRNIADPEALMRANYMKVLNAYK